MHLLKQLEGLFLILHSFRNNLVIQPLYHLNGMPYQMVIVVINSNVINIRFIELDGIDREAC